MNGIKKLDVFCHDQLVGTLAEAKNGKIAFEYDGRWLENGFPISPFKLPLDKKVFIAKQEPFDGLHGVFADSLPDGWGRLLVDRLLQKNHIDPYTVGGLTRLAIVGKSGMGALTYEPVWDLGERKTAKNYDKIAIECKKMLRTDMSDDLDELFQLGGSSGGARPKILTRIDGEEWIIKFPASFDKDDIGVQEYKYAKCAKKCGIDMPEIRLFSSELCEGYFGVKRFDRMIDAEGKERRVHMLSVSAILETSHRIPNLDYHILMKLTKELTRNKEELIKLFRLMCFNVFAHNRDDHSKNFSYIYDEEKDEWKLSPAYDLTYSNSIGGEHATCVDGNGNPTKHDILAVAKAAEIDEKKAIQIMNYVEAVVREELREYL